MSMTKARREELQNKLLRAVWRRGAKFSAAEFAAEQGVTTSTVYRHLAQLEAAGRLIKNKAGGRLLYQLAAEHKNMEFHRPFPDESYVWGKYYAEFLAELPKIAFNNLEYAFAEMANNAFSHSEGETVKIYCSKNGCDVSFLIRDDGVGIFRKIADTFQLPERSFAVLELAKGGCTTDPHKHSGEGVFFSSRVVDRFVISSDGIDFFGPTEERLPVAEQRPLDEPTDKGTTVYMSIDYDHAQPSSSVFAKFTDSKDDNRGFTDTIIPVRLASYGPGSQTVISRSQGRRLMARVERFKHIVLDFTDVSEIGQGFADEVFRVFLEQHPGCKIMIIEANQDVLKMCAHVLYGRECAGRVIIGDNR